MAVKSLRIALREARESNNSERLQHLERIFRGRMDAVLTDWQEGKIDSYELTERYTAVLDMTVGV